MSARDLSRQGCHAGFTLLELIVALAIFALVGVMAYAGLDAAIKTQARLKTEEARWRAIALFFLRLQEDMEAWVPRPVRSRGGQAMPAWLAEPRVHTDYGALLELTRLSDGATASEPPFRVGYRLRAGRVEWLRWPVLDAGPRAEPWVAVLLEGVAEIGFAYLDAHGVWNTRWPAPGQEAAPPSRPLAVRVHLRLDDGRTLTRLYAF